MACPAVRPKSKTPRTSGESSSWGQSSRRCIVEENALHVGGCGVADPGEWYVLAGEGHFAIHVPLTGNFHRSRTLPEPVTFTVESAQV